ncbi:hypothetical protein JCM18899A_22590 [Nocardioides sp. AN3]
MPIALPGPDKGKVGDDRVLKNELPEAVGGIDYLRVLPRRRTKHVAFTVRGATGARHRQPEFRRRLQ